MQTNGELIHAEEHDKMAQMGAIVPEELDWTTRPEVDPEQKAEDDDTPELVWVPKKDADGYLGKEDGSVLSADKAAELDAIGKELYEKAHQEEPEEAEDNLETAA